MLKGNNYRIWILLLFHYHRFVLSLYHTFMFIPNQNIFLFIIFTHCNFNFLRIDWRKLREITQAVLHKNVTVLNVSHQGPDVHDMKPVNNQCCNYTSQVLSNDIFLHWGKMITGSRWTSLGLNSLYEAFPKSHRV